VKEADETLRFLTAEGRTIPRCGYRLEDFVEDYADGEPSSEGFCTMAVQRGFERDEVREPTTIYRLTRTASALRLG
jgi:hypothetical protein